MNDTQKTRVVESLVGLMERGDEVDRCCVCRALGELGDRASAGLLIERLRDEDIDVCIDAAAALGRLGEVGAAPALLETLTNDPDGEVKTAAVDALGRLGGAEVVKKLMQVAATRPNDLLFDAGSDWDAWWDIQLKSVEALGRLNSDSALPVLTGILEDEESQDIENEVLIAMARIGGEADGYLVRQLKEAGYRERRRTARALRKSRSLETLKALGWALKDENSGVRQEAVESLAEREAVRFLPAILILFRDPDAGVRNTALRAAEKLAALEGAGLDGTGLAVGTLLPLLDDGDARVRRTVLNSLAGREAALDDAALEKVLSLIAGDADADVVSAAGKLLTRQRPEGAAETIVALLRDEGRPAVLRRSLAEIVGGLGRWNAAVEEALIESIKHPDKLLRLAALGALAELDAGLGSETSLEALAGPEVEPAEQYPLAIVAAALAGELLQPEQEETPREREVVDEPGGEEDLQMAEAADTEGAGEGVCVATEAEQEIPLSTLDAILMKNEAIRDRTAANGEPDMTETEAAEEETADTRRFLDLLEERKRLNRRLFDRGRGSVAIDVRREAARIMGRINNELAVQALTAALADEDQALRREAAEALGTMAAGAPGVTRQAEVRASLRDQLDDDDRAIRIAAIRSLGQIGNSEDAELLFGQLASSESLQRIEAVRALSRMFVRQAGIEPAGLEEAIERLTGLLADADSGVRREAIQGLLPLLAHPAAAGDETRRQAVVQGAVDAAFLGADGQVAVMVESVRAIDGALATERLLEKLAVLESSTERRFAVEMLTALHRPAQDARKEQSAA